MAFFKKTGDLFTVKAVNKGGFEHIGSYVMVHVLIIVCLKLLAFILLRLHRRLKSVKYVAFGCVTVNGAFKRKERELFVHFPPRSR